MYGGWCKMPQHNWKNKNFDYISMGYNTEANRYALVHFAAAAKCTREDILDI